jgi:hypothetical protein
MAMQATDVYWVEIGEPKEEGQQGESDEEDEQVI